MLFDESGRDWARFHVAVETVGALETSARQARLDELQAAAELPVVP
jgi:predicted aminopeptidase